MSVHQTFTPATPAAIVTRRVLDREDLYLHLDPQGVQQWIADPLSATVFPSMREAARMALKLPAECKAFGMRRDIELAILH